MVVITGLADNKIGTDMNGDCGVIDAKGNVVIPFGEIYEVDYDDTYRGEEIKALNDVNGQLYVLTEESYDDLLNLYVFLTNQAKKWL